jgi:DNA polymerase III epsilon subunit-like protein
MTKKIAFIYVDTNGLHKIKSGSEIDENNLEKWARLLGVYYEICERQNQKLNVIIKRKIIIKPDFDLNTEACKYNGFTDEYVKSGIKINDAIEILKNDFKNIDVYVCHNLEFHLRSIQAEFIRLKKEPINFGSKILIDIMNFNHNFEYPKLQYLVEQVLKKKYEPKSRYQNVVYLKNIFDNLYTNFEKNVVSNS